MGQSGTLNSLSKGNWTEDNHLTKEIKDDKNLEIYKDVVANYYRNLEVIKDKTDEVDTPVLNFPNYTNKSDLVNLKRYYKKVQNWEGVVTKIDENSFSGKLYDLNIGGTFELAEFNLEEVSPSDLNLMYVGANFYWSVGNYMENGQSINRSDIRFQRLIKLDADDIERAKQNIENKYSNLKERVIDNTTA